jgi:catechol 2,3-dioxygenase-like lactoylglutathione lyase family enzyme
MHACARSSRVLSSRLLALLVLLSAAPGSARERAATASPLLGASPGPFVALSVANLDRQVAWYRDTLGFTVTARGTVGDRKIPYAHLREGTILLELLQWPGARPRAQAAPGTADPVELHGFFKSGVVVADVAALYHSLRSQGVRFDYELRKHSNGSRSFGLRDPEDNLWQFFGDLPAIEAG